MPRSASMTVLGLLLLLGACGGDPLSSGSASPDDVVDAWAEVICAGEPTPDDGPDGDGVVRTVRCASKAADAEGYDVESRLTVYADAGDVPDLEGVDCDISYSLIQGATWVSELEARWGADDLLEVAGERICEGN